MPLVKPQHMKSLNTIALQPQKIDTPKIDVIMCMDLAGKSGNEQFPGKRILFDRRRFPKGASSGKALIIDAVFFYRNREPQEPGYYLRV